MRMSISFRIIRMFLVVSGTQKDFLGILNCQDQMSMTNTTKQTWDTVSSTFESSFGNNNFGHCVLELALESRLYTSHPYSHFNDLFFVSYKSTLWGRKFANDTIKASLPLSIVKTFASTALIRITTSE